MISEILNGISYTALGFSILFGILTVWNLVGFLQRLSLPRISVAVGKIKIATTFAILALASAAINAILQIAIQIVS